MTYKYNPFTQNFDIDNVGGGSTITLTGDVTGSGTGSLATTLANSGVTAGTYNNSATAITPLTIDVKGRITSTGIGVTVTPAFSSITSTPTTLSGYGITDAATSTHIHGNITNAGAIGVTANLPIITTTSGVLTAGSFGSTVNTFCQGNDARLSDTRTPTDGSVTDIKVNSAAAIAGTKISPNFGAQNILTTGTITGRLTPPAGTATAGTAPLDFVVGTNLTVPEAGAVEYDGTVATLTPNTSLGRAVIATPVYTLGASPSTTLTLNTNVPLFPAANDTITLPIGTYLVETEFQITVATSTVGATVAINIQGGGTAVGTVSWTANSSITQGGTSNLFRRASASIATSAVVTASSAVAGRVYIVRAMGIMRITTQGTIIPSVQWSATLTNGVLTWEPSNYMIITPMATSSTANFTGAFS